MEIIKYGSILDINILEPPMEERLYLIYIVKVRQVSVVSKINKYIHIFKISLSNNLVYFWNF